MPCTESMSNSPHKEEFWAQLIHTHKSESQKNSILSGDFPAPVREDEY